MMASTDRRGGAAMTDRPGFRDDEISLREIFDALARRKRLIGLVTAAFFIIGLLYAVLATPLYTASVTARPQVEESGLSGLASQFGGAAALAGFDLGGGGAEKEEYMAILESRDLTEDFIARYDVKPLLFPDRWDDNAQRWKDGEPGVVGRIARALSAALASLSGDQGWQAERGPVPTDWEAHEEFVKLRRIDEDVQTGLVTIAFEYEDPQVAARWANDYVAMANAEIRADAIAEASRALAYLDEEVQKTTVAGLRETVFSLIEAQLEKITLANARPEYAFKVLDPAVVPEERSHPKRGLIVVLALVLGAAIGAFWALAVEGYRGSLGSTGNLNGSGRSTSGQNGQ